MLSQSPKEIEFDLISSIGGICGLFIGVSFVSLFEIGEILIEAFHIVYEKIKLKQPKQIVVMQAAGDQ